MAAPEPLPITLCRQRPYAAGLSAVRQATTARAALKVQVAVPLAPAVACGLSACSAIWPAAASQRSVHPEGAVTTEVLQSQPTPPINMAPLVAVVMLPTVMLVAE